MTVQIKKTMAYFNEGEYMSLGNLRAIVKDSASLPDTAEVEVGADGESFGSLDNVVITGTVSL